MDWNQVIRVQEKDALKQDQFVFDLLKTCESDSSVLFYYKDDITLPPMEQKNLMFEYTNNTDSDQKFIIYTDKPTVCKLKTTELSLAKGAIGKIKFTLSAPSSKCTIDINLLITIDKSNVQKTPFEVLIFSLSN